MRQIEVLALIEKLRAQLVELVQRKPLLDPEVVKLSQMLDSFLNLYQDLSANRTHPTISISSNSL